MTDAQLYLAVGLPTAITLTGIVVNIALFELLGGRMARLEKKLGG